MTEKMKSIMEAADRVTVRSIAQTPYCVQTTQTPAEMLAVATERRYDSLPIREHGVIRRIIRTRDLEHLASWSNLASRARKITVEDLVAGDAPIFSALERIGQRPFLLCLGCSDIDGIVTVYDLNQPAAQYFGFALAIIVESEIARAIETDLQELVPGDADEAAIRLAIEVDVRGCRSKVDKWRTQRQESIQLSFLNSLSFGDKLKMVKRGLSHLTLKLASSDNQLLGELGEVKRLRDEVAHDLPTLGKHEEVCRRLRIAHRLARALTGLQDD